MSKGNWKRGKIKRNSLNFRWVTEATVTNLDVAGIDVSKPELMVCISSERTHDNMRVFKTFTADLEELADWLRAHRIKSVAFEATGDYWKPLYRVLRRKGLEAVVFLPGVKKQFARPKTDVHDGQFIWRLHTHGMLKNSFVPEAEIAKVRTYDRWKEEMLGRGGSSMRHMQKALLAMNLRLDVVLTDIMGKSGQAIIRAILAGERDARKLAEHRDPRVKATRAEVEQALQGEYREEHLLVLRQALAMWELCQSQAAECDEQILGILEALAQQRRVEIGEVRRAVPEKEKLAVETHTAELLTQIFGTDVTDLPGIGTGGGVSLLGEMGYDMRRWPTAGAQSAWTRLAPEVRITGGKALKGKGPKRALPRAGRIFERAANCAWKTQTMFGAKCRRLNKRLSRCKVLKAVGRQIQTTFYEMVSERKAYQGTSAMEYDARFRERELAHLKAKAKNWGMELVPLPAA